MNALNLAVVALFISFIALAVSLFVLYLAQQWIDWSRRESRWKAIRDQEARWEEFERQWYHEDSSNDYPWNDGKPPDLFGKDSDSDEPKV